MGYKTKWLSPYDLMLLNEAKTKLNEIYQFHYTESKKDKLSRRIETILKKVDELAKLEIEIKK